MNCSFQQKQRLSFFHISLDNYKKIVKIIIEMYARNIYFYQKIHNNRMSINEYFCPVLRLIHFSQNFKIQLVVTWTWLQFLSLMLRWDSEQGSMWGCEGHVLLQAVFVQCKWHKDKICTTLSIDHYSKINVGIHFFSFLFCSSLPPAKSAQIFFHFYLFTFLLLCYHKNGGKSMYSTQYFKFFYFTLFLKNFCICGSQFTRYRFSFDVSFIHFLLSQLYCVCVWLLICATAFTCFQAVHMCAPRGNDFSQYLMFIAVFCLWCICNNDNNKKYLPFTLKIKTN